MTAAVQPVANPHLLAGMLAESIARLADAGVASPRHDAEELAADVLGVRRGSLAGIGGVDAGVAERLSALVCRRAAREPLQYLTGRAGFRRLDLAVGQGVFIPRPETESVVEWCLGALSDVPAPVVVDLCAGSGAIALSLAQELAGRPQVHAVECEDEACRWLQRNLAGMTAAGGDVAPGRVSVHQQDAAAPMPELGGRVDLVVSNPPYIAEGTPVDPEVGRHEPPAALWAGADGLDLVRQVERGARRLLRRGGRLAVEHAADQGGAVPALLADAGWNDIEDHPDLAGRPRFATARWEESP